MKKKKVARQILSTALCVMMLLAYVPQMAFAEDDAGMGGTSYIAGTEADTDTSVGAGSVTRTATGSAVSVASVTTTTGTTSYTDFATALDAAQGTDGSTLKLLADHNGAVEVTSGSFTLDLNGYSITNKPENDNEAGHAIEVIEPSYGLEITLIITDSSSSGSGSITGGNCGIYNYNGMVTINGGSITGGRSGVDNHGGAVTISDGVTVTGTGFQGVLNRDGGKVEITGGSITGEDTAITNNGGTVAISGNAKVMGTRAEGVNNVPSDSIKCEVTISGDATVTGNSRGVFNVGEMKIDGGTIRGSEIGVLSSGTMTITGAPIIEGRYQDFNYTGGTIDLSGVTEGRADGWTVCCETAMTIGGTTDTNLILPTGYEVQVSCQAVESMDVESAGTGIVAKTGTHSGEHVYSAEENKITESCACGEAEIGSAVITAEGGTYNGSAYGAVVTNEGTFKDKIWSITYQKDSEVLTGAPVNAGTYTASISLGEGVTASVDFTIEEKTLTVTEATAVTKTYDGSAAVAVTGVTLDGIISGDDVSVVLTGLTGTVDSANAGTYTKVTLPVLSLTGEQAENYILPEGAAETNVTINKAAVAPNLPESTMSVSYEMETVGAVTLPAGWVWAEADAAKALVVDTAVTATAVYTGTDKGNYETETASVAITRSTCSHTGGTETRNAVSATCTAAGYTGDTYCKDCGAWLGRGTSIAKTSHRDSNNDAACDACGYVMAAPNPVVTPKPTPEVIPTVTPGPTAAPEATPTVTPGPTAAPEATPTVTPEATPAPTYHPEKSWITEEISKAYEEAAKQYDVLLGTSAKDASMVKTMQVGGTIDLNYYGVKNWKRSDYSWNWTSSDESVATVNDTGVVTMLSEGIVIIRLELVHKPTGEQLSVAPMLVGVPEAEYDIFLGTSAKDASMVKTMQVGETIDLNFYGVKNWKKGDYEYEWTTSDEEIATVNEAGLVTAKAPGQVIVRLKLKRKSTGEYLVVAPVVLTVPEKTEE